uniref:Adaptor protein ClpS core domain-containing protein n=1 Tax=Davidia involucrata TaxID=16924 RepID=A0A5B7BK23_DAVIN
MAVISCSAPTSISLTKLLHLTPLSPTLKTPNNLSLKGKNPQRCAVAGSIPIKARFGSSKGGAGLLERPTFDQSEFDPATQVEEGGDIGRLRDRRAAGSGDSYRVLLIDDKRHTENLVVKVLPQVVPSVTPDDARRLFNLSQENGVAVVIVTVKEHAEFYSQMMIRGGLRSTIEPDSNAV